MSISKKKKKSILNLEIKLKKNSNLKRKILTFQNLEIKLNSNAKLNKCRILKLNSKYREIKSCFFFK